MVKHLAMRRTLWVFDAADLPAVQSAASDRVAANERKRLIADVVKAGIAADGDAWLDDGVRCGAAAPRRTRATPAHASCAPRFRSWRATTTRRPERLGAERVPSRRGC